MEKGPFNEVGSTDRVYRTRKNIQTFCFLKKIFKDNFSVLSLTWFTVRASRKLSRTIK